MDKSLGSENAVEDGKVVPVFCEFVVRKDGEGYDERKWSAVYYIEYPDQTFFMRCTPPEGGPIESLEFRGGALKSYTSYPISGETQEGQIQTHFVLPEFAAGSYSDPEGEFSVRLITGEGLGSWFIGDFKFALVFFAPDGKEVKYSIESLVFQVQVNHVA